MTVPSRVVTIPAACLVVLIGASGSGKSTFAARHFAPTEILSSDHYRAVVSDDASDQGATQDAFAVLHHVAAVRLRRGKLTVIDATNVKPQDRAQYIEMAKQHDVLPVAIVLNLDERISQARNEGRPDRQFGAHVVRNHVTNLRRSLRGLAKEGFRYVTILNSPEEIDAVRIDRTPLYTDRRRDHGPYDIIGDIHGCYDETLDLLAALGYAPDDAGIWRHPAGRRIIFLGDLVDRGPNAVATVDLARRMVAAEAALCVPGNHDMKLVRYLNGHNVQITHGLNNTIAQIDALTEDERTRWQRETSEFFASLTSHYVLDDGKLVVAHAGMKAEYQGRASGRVRAFALFGETTGETDDAGLPVRGNWAADYRGTAAVVYGHTAVDEPAWLNNTIDIDTGCVYGGKLTALRWPERELVSVPARQVYAERKVTVQPPEVKTGEDGTRNDTESPRKDAEYSTESPSRAIPRSSREIPRSVHPSPSADDIGLLRLEDVAGKQIVTTRLMGKVTLEADHTAAALEVMSRFALDPRWLIYLPPTMAPSETSQRDNFLEYPDEAFAYFRKQGVATAVCEEKHMGSRAVIVLARDAQAAARRFGVEADGPHGVCYTRTGRQFFDDPALDAAFIARMTDILNAADVWDRYQTDWICLDAEIMPWNVKARELLRTQYAPVGAAGKAALEAAISTTATALDRGQDVAPLLERLRARRLALEYYIAAYRRYCWDLDGLEGVRVAPFHLLATEGRTYFDRDHLWHMAELARLAEQDRFIRATRHRAVDLADEAACRAAAGWWEREITGEGGEGMVIKPLEFIAHKGRRLVQPAIKCRGSDYLHIIYGPDYLLPGNLERLRSRNLNSKRSLAQREFALGVEALERFTRGEPLWSVHQAVFGVLAMESEPVDPRL
jgi:protein phosphatase